MKARLDRRKFLRNLLILGAGCGFIPNVACSPSNPAPSPLAATPVPTTPAAPSVGATAAATATPSATAAGAATAVPTAVATAAAKASDLVVARGSSPEAITRAAIGALGGMGRFVKSGSEVIVKPNICVDYHTYEYAATTNPEVVATLVKLCLEAGAKRVRVMDAPFGGTTERAYANSGIADAVKAAGGQMEVMSNLKYQDTAIPGGRDIKKWKIYRDVVDGSAVLINVPIAKTHDLAGLTMGMKNLMGVIQDRGSLHTNINQRLADLSTVVRPALTVVDGVRVLLTNGPTGGRLSDVKEMDTVIASPDIVAADSYGATLFGKKGSDLGYLRNAAAMGLGILDLSQITVKEVTA
jgi:uncharacterized protein (DUF362 family)